VSSSSEIPSSVRSLRSFPLRRMYSLHHFSTPISSGRNASVSPAFWRNRFLTVLVSDVYFFIERVSPVCCNFH
jgi:hypothetical protein